MTILGTVGIADKGTYSPTATYKKGNFVLYNGSSWLALQDDLTGVEPIEGANWKYLARGFLTELLSEISATDTQGLLGAIGATVTGQALIDELADRVATKLLPIANLVNNGASTVEGFALDSRYGKTLTDEINTLNSDLDKIGTFQTSIGISKTIAANTKNWLCDWFAITPGTYLVGFTLQPMPNVNTYLKITDGDPTAETTPRELLLIGSGSASKIITVTSSKIVSVLIDNLSNSDYIVYSDPTAYFAWALRLK